MWFDMRKENLGFAHRAPVVHTITRLFRQAMLNLEVYLQRAPARTPAISSRLPSKTTNQSA